MASNCEERGEETSRRRSPSEVDDDDLHRVLSLSLSLSLSLLSLPLSLPPRPPLPRLQALFVPTSESSPTKN